MKPRVALQPHLSVEQIKERLYGSRNGHHASYWQIILTVSLNPGKATREYCAYLGVSDTKFHRVVSLYNEKGASFCDDLQWGGRREKRCLMSFVQEEEVLQHWTAIVPAGTKAKNCKRQPIFIWNFCHLTRLNFGPTEHLWDYIREQKGFNNHSFYSMDELEDRLEAVLKQLHQEKNYIQSLCTFEWMINLP